LMSSCASAPQINSAAAAHSASVTRILPLCSLCYAPAPLCLFAATPTLRSCAAAAPAFAKKKKNKTFFLFFPPK
jgi:hypothetical protein